MDTVLLDYILAVGRVKDTSFNDTINKEVHDLNAAQKR